MRSNKIAFLIVFVLAILFFGLKYYSQPLSPNEFVEKVRESSNIDNINLLIQKENYIRSNLDSMINHGNYANALSLLDTVNLSSTEIFDYRGQIDFKQGKFRNSIKLYSQAIEISHGSNYKAISHRSEAYSRIGLFDSAIRDVKPIALMNNDYSLQLAEIYEAMDIKDSAIKYYRAFLSDYFDSSSLKKKLEKLENGG